MVNIQVVCTEGASFPITSFEEEIICILGIHDYWNDFSYRSTIRIFVKLKNHSGFSDIYGFIGFLTNSKNETNGVEKLNEILKGADKLLIPLKNEHRFFTMLKTMDQYRELVKKYGIEDTKRILLSLKDIVAVNEFEPKNGWTNLLKDQDIFSYSFIRNSESFYAYRNAHSVLYGLNLENSRSISSNIGINFKLSGKQNPYNLKFKFDHHGLLPKRINILIGKNGVGKSQTLASIVHSAINGSDSFYDLETNDRPIINRILAFAPTNEANTIFPENKSESQIVWYRKYCLNRIFSESELTATAQIISLARSTESINDMDRWDIFKEAIKCISNYNQLYLKNKEGYGYTSIMNLFRGGEQEKLKKFSLIDESSLPVRFVDDEAFLLSSGEISILTFAAHVVMDIEAGSLVLIDEPETHLHPNFISIFSSVLDSVLKDTGSSAILSTHSVYFVREVFRDQVTILSIEEDGTITANHPTLRTFGADIGAISFFVFGEDYPSGLAKEVTQRLINSGEAWDKILFKYKSEFSSEFLISLKQQILFGTNDE